MKDFTTGRVEAWESTGLEVSSVKACLSACASSALTGSKSLDMSIVSALVGITQLIEEVKVKRRLFKSMCYRNRILWARRKEKDQSHARTSLQTRWHTQPSPYKTQTKYKAELSHSTKSVHGLRFPLSKVFKQETVQDIQYSDTIISHTKATALSHWNFPLLAAKATPCDLRA